MALLEVEDLRVVFARRGDRPFTAVDQVSFTVEPGQTIGLHIPPEHLRIYR